MNFLLQRLSKKLCIDVIVTIPIYRIGRKHPHGS